MQMAQDHLQETIDHVNGLMAERAEATSVPEPGIEPEADTAIAVAEEASPEKEQEPEEITPVKEPEGTTKDFSRRFAQLAKREKGVRRSQEDYKKLQQEVEELRSKQGNPNDAARELEELRKIAAENPRELLSRLDLDYQRLSEDILSGNKKPDDYKRDSSIDKLLNRIDQLESKLSSREEQEVVSKQETAYNNFIDEIRNFVETNNEDFELIHSRDAHGLVAEVMQEHYNSSGQVLEYKQAARLVEDHLEEEARSYFGSKKIAKKYRDSFGNEAKTEAPRQPDSRPKTLSNSVAAVGMTTDGEAHSKPMSRDEHLDHLARSYKFFGE